MNMYTFTGEGFRFLPNGFEISMPNGITVVGKVPNAQLDAQKGIADYIRKNETIGQSKTDSIYINVFGPKGTDLTLNVFPNGNIVTPLQLVEVLYTVTSLKFS